jgi:ParB family chromosome partitioning protein
LLALKGVAQIETARMVVTRELSVRETERLIATGRLKGVRSKLPSKPKDRDVLRLQEDLSQKLGTKVTIKSKRGGRGALVIEYSNLDQLDGLLRRIK